MSATAAVRIDTLAIVGVGLIGASLALALRQAGAVGRVLGVDRDPEVLARARALGVIDAATDAAGAAGADVVVVCVPVAQMGAVFASLAPHLGAQTVLTDAGSTKADVIAAAKQALGERAACFVPAHPIAGREKHGVDAALADLYRNKRVLLCPLPENGAEALARVESMWTAAGAHCHRMSAVQHDAVFAAVSHLPHLLSYALVAQIANADDAAVKLGFAGAGFRDFTRIAASDPEMWRDISLANRDALLRELDTYQSVLSHLRKLIAEGQGAQLQSVFSRASAVRVAWGDGK